jgi:hypothetical protein
MKTLFQGCAVISLSAFFYTVNAAPQLLAHWSFDSVSGNTYFDVTGHGYDALASGSGLGLAPGVVGQALSCPGSGYEIYARNSANDFNVPKFTIECWFQCKVPFSWTSSYFSIVNFLRVQSGVTNGWAMSTMNNGHVFLDVSNSSGSGWNRAYSSVTMVEWQWYHIAGTYDGSYVRIYVNGTLTGSAAFQGPYARSPIDCRIACSRRQDSPDATFQINGYLDEVKFYNDALSADSILAHYNSPGECVPQLIPHEPRHDCDRRPHLKWHPVECNTGYRIQLCPSRDFNNPIIDDSPADTAYQPVSDLPFGTMHWRVKPTAGIDLYSIPDTFVIEPPTGILSGPRNGNESFAMVQLRHGVSITYCLEKQGPVSLDIFSISGSRIAAINTSKTAAGEHTFLWDGTDKQGKSLPAGSYCAVLRLNGQVFTKKIALMR